MHEVRVGSSQPASPVTRIKSRMADDVERLLQQRRYDEVLERLLDGYEQKVIHMAGAMLKDRGRAEEVTQDVFLKVWRALPTYDGRAALSTWLYAIARNTCLSAVRAEAYRRTTPLEDVPEPRARAAEHNQVEWDRYLSRLPEAQRQVVLLFYFEEKSITDVAQMLGFPEGTVKSQLHRARRALADMME